LVVASLRQLRTLRSALNDSAKNCLTRGGGFPISRHADGAAAFERKRAPRFSGEHV